MPDTSRPCCGQPATAAWYAAAVIGRDIPGGTETREVDGYFCASHKPSRATLAAQAPGWHVIAFTCRTTQGGTRA